MSVFTHSHILLRELSQADINPEFSAVWTALTDDLRGAVAFIALHYCSTKARHSSATLPSAGPHMLPSILSLSADEACAILDLTWVTSGNEFRLVDLQSLEEEGEQPAVAEIRAAMLRSLVVTA